MGVRECSVVSVLCFSQSCLPFTVVSVLSIRQVFLAGGGSTEITGMLDWEVGYNVVL